jgi:type I restriction enzyme S subunit
MIEGLKPYAEYKESGIPWAPVLPSSWQTERAKRLFTKMQRPVRPEDEVVTCFRDGMVTLRKNRRLRGFTEATVESGYQGIRKGDLVIHGMDAFAGAIGVSDSDGKSTPVYNVCHPGVGVVASYYAHTVREMSRAQWILALAKGIRERSTDFRYEMFGNQFVPLPPPDEQAAIVRFLDHANRKIDGFIRAKRKLIGLLNEQKQAIIHRAVTRGLHPDAPLKPSGIPWLGDIPVHWELRRVRSCILDSRAGIWGTDPAPSNKSDQIVCVRVADFDMQFLTVGVKKLTLRAVAESARTPRLLQRGDILLEKSGGGEAEPIGRVVLFNLEMPAISSNFIVRIRADRSVVHPEFLLQVLSIMQKTRRNVPFIKQTTGIQNLNEKAYFSLPMGVPPLKEQTELIAALSHAVDPITTAIARTEREIALMQEYRTRLTADIVTGKLDVREAAAKLPDLPTEPAAEPLTDEALADTETEDAEA